MLEYCEQGKDAAGNPLTERSNFPSHLMYDGVEYCVGRVLPGGRVEIYIPGNAVEVVDISKVKIQKWDASN